MGFSDADIQWMLRWRSLAFTAHLRNIAVLATSAVTTRLLSAKIDFALFNRNLPVRPLATAISMEVNANQGSKPLK